MFIQSVSVAENGENTQWSARDRGDSSFMSRSFLIQAGECVQVRGLPGGRGLAGKEARSEQPGSEEWPAANRPMAQDRSARTTANGTDAA